MLRIAEKRTVSSSRISSLSICSPCRRSEAPALRIVFPDPSAADWLPPAFRRVVYRLKTLW